MRLDSGATPDAQNRIEDSRSRSSKEETFVNSARMTATVTERHGWGKGLARVGDHTGVVRV